MRYSKSQIRSEDDLWKVFDRVLQARGWGRCLSMTKGDEDRTTVYVFKCTGTPFTYERKANEPACDMLRGLIVGWLETYLDKRAVAHIEAECASTGSPFCVFQVTFSR